MHDITCRSAVVLASCPKLVSGVPRIPRWKMCTPVSTFSILTLLWILAPCEGFLVQPCHTTPFVGTHRGHRISLGISLRPFSSILPVLAKEDARKNPTEEEIDDDDGDFLLMPVKPKILNHGMWG